MKKKQKALLNRSLSLSKKEYDQYRKKLIGDKREVSKIKQIKNRIINLGLLEIIDNLPDSFVDLLFIDPPYNLDKKFGKAAFKELDSDKYEKWIDSWLGKMKRLLKPDASVYICGDWKSSSALFNVASKYFIVRNRITWEREKGRGAKSNWKNCSEDIWFCTVSKRFRFNVDNVKLKRKVLAPYKHINGEPKDWKPEGENSFRITYPSNIWTDITVPFWSMPENTEHPTQKPEKLLAKIILASSNEGNMVFDPFLGSGTTAVTAKKLNRKYCGVEIDQHYCCIAEKRLALADEDSRIQGYEDGVFWERNTFAQQGKEQILKKKSKKM